MFFMLHSMLFFWHRYELPAVAMGLVNPDHPRQYAPPPPPPLQQHPVNLAPQPQPMEHDRYISDVRGGQAARYPYQPVLEQPHLPFPTMHQDAHLQPPPSYVRSHVRRTLSFNTTTSGAFSRNSSNAGMHQRNNDYEDDDGSMQFYVGGEVVVPSSHHRGERTRVPSSLNVPSYVTNETTDGPIGTSAAPQTTQADEQQRRPSYSTWNSRNERYMGGLETLVASAVSADEDSVQFVRTPMGSHDNSAPTSPMALTTDPSQQPEATGRSRLEDTNTNVGVYSETSALHAILINGMNEDDSSLALHPETTMADSVQDDDSLPALPLPSTIFR
jgi:hypothetical protein